MGGRMKRCALVLAVLFCAGMAGAQQMTRYAVVDLTKILESFYSDSKTLRDFEEKQRSVQAEIDKMSKEIKDLQQKKLESQQKGDDAKVVELDSLIQKKTEFVKDYYKVKNEELDSQRKKLFESSEFASEVYAEIRRVAEGEGYSMVIDWKRASELRFLIWYSTSIDITDKVIENLTAKKR
jgi:outer membrane protein